MRLMDGDLRPSALSYEVNIPEGENSAERPIIVGGSIAAALLFLSLGLGWLVLGYIRDSAIVTRGFPLLTLAVPLAVVLWMTRTYWRRARQTALVVVTGLALLAAILSSKGLNNVKAALPQVQESIDSVKLPPGFRLVSESTSGDRFCHKGCPTVHRRYTAPADDPDPVSTFIQAMFAQGWDHDPDIDPKLATFAEKRGIQAQLQEPEPHVVDITLQRLR
jgi:hypothetical protein